MAYHRERAAALATGMSDEISKTDFTRFRRGRLYLDGGRDGAELTAAHNELTAALEKDNDTAISAAATRILDRNQADLRAHAMLAFSLERSGRSDEATFHRQIAHALISSIAAGRDGRGFDSAWTAFRIAEEYEFLKSAGCAVEAQALARHDGRVFDVLTARRLRDNTRFEAYFDITELFSMPID